MDDAARELGIQPISAVMASHNLKAHDVVAASSEQLTHKMVARACKGRRLTEKTKRKVLNGLNLAVEKEYTLGDIFNY